jgi:hypothetical protein
MSAPAGGQWLAQCAESYPALVTRAGQIIAAGGRTNDAALHGRQYLEHALRAVQFASLTGHDYRYAARQMEDAGRTAHGDILETIAAADAELRAAWPAWEHRYDGRLTTVADRDVDTQIHLGALMETGRPGQGVDGAWYRRAYYSRSGKPAVVITTSAMTEEVANFANTEDAGRWLTSRSPESAGPLATTVNGPTTRTAREEEVLAWVVRKPGDTEAFAQLVGAVTWTTHLRAELFATMSWLTSGGGSPGYGVIEETFFRRLLRAPGSAAAEIGWPGAARAMAYLQRLAATTVTPGQARLSAEALARAETVVGAPAPGRITRPSTVSAQAPLLQPPLYPPSRSGPAPRK